MATFAGRWVAAAIFVTLSDPQPEVMTPTERAPATSTGRVFRCTAPENTPKATSAVKDNLTRRRLDRLFATRESQSLRERLERGAGASPLAQRPDPLFEQAALGRPGGEAHDLQDVDRHAQGLGA